MPDSDNPLSILLIDDDKISCQSLRPLVDKAFGDRAGIDVCESLEQAGLRLLEHDFDVVLLAHHLYDQQVLVSILEQSGLETPPLIVLVDDNDGDIDCQAMFTDALDCLVKSELHCDSLRRAVRYAVNRHQQLSALQQSERSLRTILNTISEGLCTVNQEGLIIECNPAAEATFGMSNNRLAGQPIQQIISGLEWNNLPEILGARFETEATRSNGSIFPVEVLVSDYRVNQQNRYTVVAHEITSRKQAEEKIRYQAMYDSLTDLPNRRLLLDRLEQALGMARRHDQSGALMFIDLDRFKSLNDSLGHAAGDQLLIEVASRLKTAMRETDTVARLGGDEFVVLLTELDANTGTAAEHARLVAEKIRRQLGNAYQIKGQPYHCTPSIGVAMFSKTDTDSDELMRRADAAMYVSKSKGRNRISVYQPEMGEHNRLHFEIENQLRDAMQQNQLSVYYQPQVDINGKIVGAEALLRWLHPQNGLLLPEDILPVAEQCGLMSELGLWILNSAMQQIQDWRQRQVVNRDFYVSVNISPAELRHGSLVTHIIKRLETQHLDADNLKLEVTEDIYTRHLPDAIEKMHILQEQGIKFALDDFGKGLSSLTYMKQLPLSQIKIDQSFSRSLITSKNETAIIEAILAMSRHLGLSVVAEGVEDQQVLAYLQQKGCTTFQGHLFSEALPAAEFEKLLGESPDRHNYRQA